MGLSAASVLIAVLAALVVTFIVLVNRIHTVTAGPQLDRARQRVRELRSWPPCCRR